MSDHLGGASLDQPDLNTFLPYIWEFLIATYQIKSMVDVGAGAAWNTAWWHQRGFYSFGIEGWPEAIAKTRMPMERMIVHDYTLGPLVLPQTFDLAWCSEFVEHVDAKFIPNFMATFKCCKLVCLTYATPGQTGFHHVNEQEFEYWEAKMKEAGFEHLAEDTKWMRSTDNGAAWGRKSLCLFRNLGLPGSDRKGA